MVTICACEQQRRNRTGTSCSRQRAPRRATSQPGKQPVPATRLSCCSSTSAPGGSCGSAEASTGSSTSPQVSTRILIIAWLWSERAGVISHQTALALHGLSDALPAYVHLTLPHAWRRRRFRIPAGVVLHHADVSPDDRAWFGAAPITNPRRTLNDCAREAMAPDLLRQAARQAIRRGLVPKAELSDVDEALRPFGGLGA